ncbi:hypothetical protein [Vibrio cholerae]|uniref:hypothetical protein n=1 Tax=Vibrio cholerae TaxID=666 RepID=UPI0039675227
MPLHRNRAIIFIVSIYSLIGCNSEGAFQSLSDVSASLYDIKVSSNSKVTYLPQQMKAIGYYDDGTERDITSLVGWYSNDLNTIRINEKGLAIPVTLGSTEIYAEYGGIASEYIVMNVVDSQICGHTSGVELGTHIGGGINDGGMTSAVGACLKIRQLKLGNNLFWYTSPPSASYLLKLGYISDMSPVNSGDSFGVLMTEMGISGPVGQFGLFTQNGKDVISPGFGSDLLAGKSGQYDRWCRKLNQIGFAGKTAWSTTTSQDLLNLYNAQNTNSDSLYDLFGWPTGYQYWAKDVSGRRFEIVSMKNGWLNDAHPADLKYVSCIFKF